ncbi:MAG: carbohydrate-binding protein, partial [Ruminococcus sp.]|nr:carbohydrate-binding protein [Ruminococcus sp.]
TTTTTTTTTTTAPPVTVPDRYYAIEAEMYDGWSENTNAGFAGEGYFNYNNAVGSYVEWTVTVPEDGNYQVDFRYANGTEVNRPVSITVNGSTTEAYYMDFNGTGAWTEWATNTIVLPLKAGKNTIKAYATTANGGPNMDYIELIETDAPAATPVKPKDGRQVEKLDRGVSAAYTGKGVLVSWRILATDDPSTTFDLWKNGETKLGTFTLQQASNYLDASGTATDWYTIDTFVNGEMTEYAQTSRNLSTKSTGQSGAYFDIPLNKPAGGTTPDGVEYTYSANDASVGDVDGDGEYEIILKWDPSNSKDNANDGYTGNVFIDCYEMDGTQLWRIDLGKNIRAGAHYTQMMVYDFDGNGKAELICKTADGTVDGKGTVIGDGSKDYRNGDGRIISGPEYLTVFEGATGKAVDTIDFQCARGNAADWGDDWGNRCDRFTAVVAYLDGKTPSVVMNRGYYAKTTSTAYNYRNGKLELVWAFDTGSNSSAAGYHDGNHSAMPADVDLDGKDEIVLGSAVIDDNGKLLYTSGLGHGDAFHIGDLDPSNPGIEIFMCHEGEGFGISLRDGETGNLIFREEGGGDTGRCLAGNFIASNPGSEYVGIHNNIIYNSKMEQVGVWSDVTKWNQNSLCYWTGSLERGVLDRLMVDQHGTGRVFTGEASYNNSSKSNVSLSADIFGDWREEIIAPANDSAVLRVFGTTFTTEYPIFTLMHDVQYRTQAAGQNVGYNQPPHLSFYLGSDTGVLPTAPTVYVAE